MEANEGYRLFMVQYSGFCLRADLRKAVFNRGIKQSKSIGKIIVKHKKSHVSSSVQLSSVCLRTLREMKKSISRVL